MIIRYSIPFLYTLSIILLLIAWPSESYAQKYTEEIWNIITLDGNEFNGKMISRNIMEIRLETQSLGIITIQVSDIRKISSVDPNRIHGGEVWQENSQDTRYFFGPSSYGLKAGEGYYQNAWIFFNQVAYGVTDNFSIGVGMVPLFLFAGAATPVWITPKVSIPIQKDIFNIGAGALVGTVFGEEFGAFGVAYGTTTFGGREKNLSLGLGYGFADGEWSNSPTITISGILRTGKRGYLISENYLIGAGDTTVGFLSGGGRVVWSKISLDFGLFFPVGNDIGTFAAVPWLGFVIPFG